MWLKWVCGSLKQAPGVGGISTHLDWGDDFCPPSSLDHVNSHYIPYFPCNSITDVTAHRPKDICTRILITVLT